MGDQQTNIQFVQEVQRRPLLYNITLPEYTRRDLTEAAWDEVGKAMNLTGAACKERWKNLRTVYSRHLKRSIEEPSEKRKKYYLTDHMSFVLPFIKPGANHAVHSPDPEGASSGMQYNLNPGHYSESLEGPCHDQEEDVIFPFISIKRDPSEVEYQTLDRVDAFQSSNESNTARESASDRRNCPSKGSEPGQRTVQKQENRPSLDISNFETRRMFLLGLLDEVALMSDAQMRCFKRKVLKLIDEVLES